MIVYRNHLMKCKNYSQNLIVFLSIKCIKMQLNFVMKYCILCYAINLVHEISH